MRWGSSVGRFVFLKREFSSVSKKNSSHCGNELHINVADILYFTKIHIVKETHIILSELTYTDGKLLYLKTVVRA